MTISDLIKEVMNLAEEKGLGVDPKEVNSFEKIALIHTEVSEAMEAFRHNNMNGPHGLAEELADVVIRVMHLAGLHKVDIEKEIIKKLEHNRHRIWDWDKMNETSNNAK